MTSAEGLADVLVTKSYDFQKLEFFRLILTRLLGSGIIVVEGNEPKGQRRSLMPTFAFRHIKDLYPVFWSKSRQCVHKMAQ